MRGAGIDTVSLLVLVSSASASSLLQHLPHERRSERSRHHYGNFDDWSATLHRAGDQWTSAVLVLTASLPRLLYGENTCPVGTLGAAEAVTQLRDRLLEHTGVYVDIARSTVCRVDFCATVSPYHNTRQLLASIATVHLPRRRRAVLDNGVTFYGAGKLTIYDKQREVEHLYRRIRRTRDARAAAHAAALVRARSHLRRVGAVRIECRLSGSRQIADRLRLERPLSPAVVLTTAHAYEVLSASIGPLERGFTKTRAEDAAARLAGSLGSSSGARAFSVLALTELTGSLESAAETLRMSRTTAVRLLSRTSSAGVEGVDLGGDEKLPLAFPAISATWTDRFERRIQRRWHETQSQSSQDLPNFSLSSAA